MNLPIACAVPRYFLATSDELAWTMQNGAATSFVRRGFSAEPRHETAERIALPASVSLFNQVNGLGDGLHKI